MKPCAVVLVFSIVGIASLAATGCSVHRQSSEFACIVNGECKNGRVCERGYCVERAGAGSNNCPSPCTSCNPGKMTCKIECSADKPCGIGAICPPGFDCTIACSAPDACEAVDCLDATSCDITCTGSRACGSIACGDGPCKTDCEGARSCGFVSCGNSCKCDVECSGAAGSQCPDTSCPFTASFDYCGTGGNVGGLCDSSLPECDVCS